ncbi:MAG: 50S ribosomal protein L20 [Candidatus Amesbacteria bacterium GW2011_GWB1_47_19]|nr:MAG: 50S ribosomal protein L20 [Candidatus Amesbacteria bacterium GW2011_GWA1_44_24]KKU31105.1 MAG: 50S ribosomal protein L20 [Candidatus Amesbacteria bacterium GW2011_GWC1_46_24]KKU67226.1 MAG: 50S ribosomal protein L20 [Candidatus Amesbacteria bacterium GW2011_GWB1_47_19]OGD05785.1 MAG: 50S ribosomal protein L20 [Candidatus Amesbacteria bacterium RIFOXYB1_FULL_47_13]HBC72642.1 50S ribosomal protein L20 [Candidatus Amesbacteria bacterium]
MRVKSPRRQRHNKVLKLAKGYRMTKHRLYKVAREAVVHAGQYAFAGRKLRRRDLRRTWIIRINAGLRSLGVTYSQFISAAKKANIEVDRKILADLAARQPEVFKSVVSATGLKLSE